jgi:hypothetical protein
MKKLIFAVALAVAMMFPVHVHAQMREFVGASGVAAFDNYSAGITAGVEYPFLKHFELDLKDTFSPITEHVALGTGRANSTAAGGFVWLSKSLGIHGEATDSMYDVTKVSKDANYAYGGLGYRVTLGGLQSRFTFDYIQQFNNGIAPNGVETSHLKGGDAGVTVVLGCPKSMCVRLTEDLVFGRVLTQGNPQCDGTFGVTGGNGPNGSCPRGSALSGGTEGSIQFVFGKGRAGF